MLVSADDQIDVRILFDEGAIVGERQVGDGDDDVRTRLLQHRHVARCRRERIENACVLQFVGGDLLRVEAQADEADFQRAEVFTMYGAAPPIGWPVLVSTTFEITH